MTANVVRARRVPCRDGDGISAPQLTRPQSASQWPVQKQGNSGRTDVMTMDRRRTLACLVAIALWPAPAASAETIRVGLPTKTYWPTTVAETAVRQKLFEKEGITAELTIYRSGAETF